MNLSIPVNLDTFTNERLAVMVAKKVMGWYQTRRWSAVWNPIAEGNEDQVMVVVRRGQELGWRYIITTLTDHSWRVSIGIPDGDNFQLFTGESDSFGRAVAIAALRAEGVEDAN